MTHGDVARGGRHGDEGLKIGRETMQPILDFIERAGSKPFFLWYAPFLPHTPHNPPQRLLAKYESPGRPQPIAKYYAMIEWLDETVGQLLRAVEGKENTMVIYLADNGWVQTPTAVPLFETRAKMSPYDAGVRTPIIIRWPGRVAPRRDDRTLATSIDLAPTILAACGIRSSVSLPGINLLAPSQRNKIFGGIFVHTSMDINHPVKNLKYRWVVRDRWKMIDPYPPNLALPLWENQPASAWGHKPELYDVVTDPHEKNDLSVARPELVRSLQGELNRWWSLR
jgi:uncharacterized sulfatase